MNSRAGFLALSAASLAAGMPKRLGAQPAPLVLRVGGILSGEMAPPLYAQRHGLYGSTIDVRLVETASGGATATAVLAGALEIGKSSLMSLIFAHLRGLPLAVIMASGVYDARYPYAELVVASDGPYRRASDLDGKTIGVSALNDMAQLAVALWIDRNGGDSRTLKYLEIPNSVSADALAQHRIDAALISQPALEDALVNRSVRTLGPAITAIAPSLMITAWFVSMTWANQHPDAVQAFVRGTGAAAAYLNAHRSESDALTAEITKIPLASIQRMPPTTSGTDLNLAQIQPEIDAAAKYGLIDHAFPARELAYAPR